MIRRARSLSKFLFVGGARDYGKAVVCLPMYWTSGMVWQCCGWISETYRGIPLNEESGWKKKMI